MSIDTYFTCLPLAVYLSNIQYLFYIINDMLEICLPQFQPCILFVTIFFFVEKYLSRYLAENYREIKILLYLFYMDTDLIDAVHT